MLFARVQDQPANTTANAGMVARWSCTSGEVFGQGSEQDSGYRGLTAISSKQFAHRASVSSLIVAKPARLGNPEERT